MTVIDPPVDSIEPEAPARSLRPEDQDPKRWIGDGWTARITRSDDDGWAVEMTATGESEPALIGPWTMGRDKKNPKPIDASSFAVLVKAANEVRARHAQQLRARMHRSVNVVGADGARRRVDLDVIADEDDPHAMVSVFDAAGIRVSRARVAPTFALTTASAQKWVDDGGA